MRRAAGSLPLTCVLFGVHRRMALAALGSSFTVPLILSLAAARSGAHAGQTVAGAIIALASAHDWCVPPGC